MKRTHDISKLFDIKNRNIVITGSSGLLGSQYANTLSAAGANVILVDLDSTKNKNLERSLRKKYRTRARSYTTDISNLQEVKKLAKNVLRDFKKIDGLINNAAYTSKGAKEKSDNAFGSFENFPMKIWQKSIDINLTKYLAAYWSGKSIRVNTLSPGGVLDTTYQDKKFVKKYSERTILGRMARKDEYNGAILFLISDASSYMTGANLIVDGGWTAW